MVGFGQVLNPCQISPQHPQIQGSEKLKSGGFLTSWCPRGALIALLLGVVSGKGQADISDAEFEARVRAYLLANPEIILQALETLSEREARSAVASKIAQYPGLFTEPAHLGIGPEDAPLRVIEFFDYRCAPCKALHPELTAALADISNIRVEMRHLPILSPGSERAARFALAVKTIGQTEQARAVHEALWQARGPLRETTFERIANEQGLNWEEVRSEMYGDVISARISRNRDIAIDLGIVGTPAFVTLDAVNVGVTDAKALVASWINQ